MMLPVFIPDWQIRDGDIAAPVIGEVFNHVLIFVTDDGDPDMYYGCFGREVTVAGVAWPLTGRHGHQGRSPGPFPTALRCHSFMLYWDAPVYTEGEVTLTGIVTATDYDTAPEGFPPVRGLVTAMTMTSLLYACDDADGRSWMPAAARQQSFRPVSGYPAYFPEEHSTVSPQLKATGVVVDLDTLHPSREAPAAIPAANVSETDESAVRLRLFPDHAKTVLWLEGPVYYPEAALSPALAAAMTAWEASYYASLTPELDWQSPGTAAAFTATGMDLARRLARELGTGFQVEFHSYEAGAVRQVFSSDAAAGNPGAARAFHAMVAEKAAEQARLDALAKEPGVGWFAHAPKSWTDFQPGQDQRALRCSALNWLRVWRRTVFRAKPSSGSAQDSAIGPGPS
ncbi:MAG: hypothetical protein ABI563_12365 [Specibacter sp.]